MKNAYPNFAPDSIFIKPVYNLNKWLEAMREIYAKLHFGTPFKESLGQVTSAWDTVERKDFATWLEYYQSGHQGRYKKAQFYTNENILGYLVPNQKSVPPVIPDFNHLEMTPAPIVETPEQRAEKKKLEQDEKRAKMEDIRKKIVGRLHAAIKHLTTHEGHMLAGPELNGLLTSLYALLQQIQTVNKISLSNQLYYDLMIRQANKLANDGFARSARFLTKFAQNAPAARMDMAQGPTPIASQTGDGVAGTLENPNPSVESLSAPVPPALQEPQPEPEKEEEKDPLDEVMENLNTGGITDKNFSTDENDLSEITLDDDFVIEAQLAPPAPQTPPQAFPAPPMASKPPAPESFPQEDMEVSLPEVAPEEEVKEQSRNGKQAPPDKDIDAIINSALSSISIKDVVRKIEDVNAIFQNRTIARELSIIDLMLSNLGLSSYFNNLSEIIQKNHEASNYSISRLSDILTKLRGAISPDSIDLTEEPQANPEVQQLQNRLQTQKDKEENRREMRKQIQDNALSEELQDQGIATQPAAPGAPEVVPPMKPADEISQVPTQIVQ